MSILAGLAKLYIAARATKSALGDIAAELETKRVALGDGKSAATMKLTVHSVRTLEERMRYVKQMARKGMVDPKFRRWVASVLNRKCGKEWCVPERDWRGEVVAIFDAWHKRVRYSRDIDGIDTFQAPSRTLEMGGADCDDSSIALAAALKAAGYPVKFRVIRTTGSRDWDHIFVLVGLPPGKPTEWMPLDASVRRPAGWHPPRDRIAATRDFDF